MISNKYSISLKSGTRLPRYGSRTAINLRHIYYRRNSSLTNHCRHHHTSFSPFPTQPTITLDTPFRPQLNYHLIIRRRSPRRIDTCSTQGRLYSTGTFRPVAILACDEKKSKETKQSYTWEVTLPRCTNSLPGNFSS